MNTKGLWVSPTEFVSFSEAKRNPILAQHIATRGRCSTRRCSATNPSN